MGRPEEMLLLDSDSLRKTVQALREAVRAKGSPHVFTGVDGFVDEIIRVVDKRHSVDEYVPIATIEAYARRLAGAAGKSTNVEFVVEQVKAGGNGPLMGEAIGRLGGSVRYVGAVGWPEVHELFQPMRAFGPVIPVAPPALTLATEFDDGKIMHGKHESLRQLTWENIVERSGGMGAIDSFLAEADLVAIVNWTMVPFLTDVLAGLSERVALLGGRAPGWFFFDLCDPEKRTTADLLRALDVIAGFDGKGRTAVLGLNEKESFAVCEALGIEPGEPDGDGLLGRARGIVEKLGLSEVVIHPTRMAVAWNRGVDGSAPQEGAAEGPYCANPKLTTGAGDHFNGGYMFGRVMGLTPEEATVVGKCASGFYVRQGRGPSLDEVALFADRWSEGRLDPWQPLS